MACVIPITSQILVEWELQQALFQADRPLVDLFANNVNHELTIYVSPISGKKACAVDAISLIWCLQNYSSCSAWPMQSWFPDLPLLSCTNSLFLPFRRDLLSSRESSGGIRRWRETEFARCFFSVRDNPNKRI